MKVHKQKRQDLKVTAAVPFWDTDGTLDLRSSMGVSLFHVGTQGSSALTLGCCRGFPYCHSHSKSYKTPSALSAASQTVLPAVSLERVLFYGDAQKLDSPDRAESAWHKGLRPPQKLTEKLL